MTIIIGILLLGILIIIHEAGHFFAAIASKVEVEAFSVGMGPVLFHHKKNRTDWRISLIPLGGYCAMKGEQDDDFSPGSMYSVHPLYRAFIAFSGPAANYLFAIIAYTIIALTGYTYYSASNAIIVPDEEKLTLSPARDAGLKTGDRITAVNDKTTDDFSQLYESISAHPDEDLNFTVERNGKILHFTIHTLMNKSTGEGKIGILNDTATIQEREAKPYPFAKAVHKGVTDSWNIFISSIKGITLLFRGVNVSEAVSGPAQITSMLGSTAKAGFSVSFRIGIVSILQFMALISISLFLMNLLPIPILDGGLILLSLIETVFHVKISRKVRSVIQMSGLIIIIAMFALALNGDINYFMRLFNAK